MGENCKQLSIDDPGQTKSIFIMSGLYFKVCCIWLHTTSVLNKTFLFRKNANLLANIFQS